MAKRSWTDEQLQRAVSNSYSIRSVILRLGLVPAGGNYEQVGRRIIALKLSTGHFTGKGWNAGLTYSHKNTPPVETLLVPGSTTQSYKLKNKLFKKGLKKPKCELCGWADQASDGRIPVELDHINGDHSDNRLSKFAHTLPKLP